MFHHNSICNLMLSLTMVWSALGRAREVQSVAYTSVLAPHAVFLTGSGWTPELVKSEFQRVQKIYDQCQIRIDLQDIRELEADDERLHLLGQSDFDIVTELGISARPIVVFAGSMPVAYSHSDEYSPMSVQKALANTSFLGWDIETPQYKEARDPNYSPVAHELAHVLCNCGHMQPGIHNLLSGDAHYVNDYVTPEQCDTFRHSPLVKPLNKTVAAATSN